MPTAPGLTIKISNMEYNIKADVDDHALKRVVQTLNDKLDECRTKNKKRDDLTLTIQAALSLAGDLYESQSKCNELQEELNFLKEKTGRLANRIDRHLE